MAVRALDRRPATRDEYQSLGGDGRAEYVDGEIVMTPRPTRQHQNAVDRLKALLLPVLPDSHTVTREWSWKPQGSDNEYIPDLSVHPKTDEDIRFTGTSVLCVEALSGNCGHDYITKGAKYAMAGLAHYWILDPVGTLDVLELDDTGYYRLAAELHIGQPRNVSFGIATVHIDLAQL